MQTGASFLAGRRKTFWGACLGVGLALAVCAALAGCGSQAAKNARASAPPPAVPVGVATVKQRDFDVYLNGLGTVQAYYTVSLKTRIDGQIMQVNFREGQDVKTGDLLIVVDPRPYQVALAQAEANLAKDQAQLVNAKAQYERNNVLYQQGVVAKQDLDTLQASFGTYDATIAADKAAIDSAKLNLTYCYIKSPINGRVGLRQVDPGNYVTAASGTAMLTITQLHPIAVVFTLPEDQLPQVQQRMRKGGALEVDAYSRDDQTKLGTGKLETVNNQIDPTTGTVRLRATFQNRNNELFPNQFVNARLLLDVKSGTTVVPQAAIQRSPQGTFVYVVDTDQTARVRPVNAGPSEGDDVSIESGLSPGELVVVEGADRLRDGSKIELQGKGPGNSRKGK